MSSDEELVRDSTDIVERAKSPHDHIYCGLLEYLMIGEVEAEQ